MDPLQHAQDHREREDRKHRIPAVVADRYRARKFRLLP